MEWGIDEAGDLGDQECESAWSTRFQYTKIGIAYSWALGNGSQHKVGRSMVAKEKFANEYHIFET